MKKIFVLGLFFNLTLIVFGQSGYSFKINLQYAQANRPEQEQYLSDLADSMQITERLDIASGLGFGVGILMGFDHTEWEFGGSYMRSVDEIGSDSANLLNYINSDITYHFGLNYLPVKFFFVGGDFIINSTNAKSNVSGPSGGTVYLEDLPSVDFHFLRGYSVGLRAQSGFYFYLNKDDNTRMRLSAFYTYGLSKYNFYTVSEKRLAGYSGDQKTNYQVMGIELGVLFGM